MYAVIQSGGRQYKVAQGDVIEVNRLGGSPGDDISLPAVMVVDGSTVKTSDLAAVKGRVVGHGRGKKIRVFTYKAKSGWKRTKGHRQDLTSVEITEIA